MRLGRVDECILLGQPTVEHPQNLAPLRSFYLYTVIAAGRGMPIDHYRHIGHGVHPEGCIVRVVDSPPFNERLLTHCGKELTIVEIVGIVCQLILRLGEVGREEVGQYLKFRVDILTRPT